MMSDTKSILVPFEELLTVREDIVHAEPRGSMIRAIVDGKEYCSDMGYAIEGIDIFLDVLKRRYNMGGDDDE